MLESNERIDELGRKDYKIIQNPNFFSFGIDSVLLSYFAASLKNKNYKLCVDLCTGSGIIPLLLHSRDSDLSIKAIEIQSEICNMAKRSIKLNNLNSNIEIIEGDLKEFKNFFEKGYADFLTVNPPYMKKNSLKNENLNKAIARHEILCDIYDISKAANYILKPGGELFIIHRPERLFDISFALFENGFEIKILQMVQPYIYKPPSNVLIMAKKGAKPGLSVFSPIIIYEEKGKYTQLLKEIYNE